MRDISLREYLEHLIAKEIERIAEVFAMQDEARKLQAAEYSRRLDELNHAHERSVADRALFLSHDSFEQFRREYVARHDSLTAQVMTTLPKDVFEQEQRGLHAWRDQINQTMNEWRGRAQSMAIVASIISSLMGGVIVLALNHLFTK